MQGDLKKVPLADGDAKDQPSSSSKVAVPSSNKLILASCVLQLLLLVVVVAYIVISQQQIGDLQFENVALRHTCAHQKIQDGGSSGVNEPLVELAKKTDSGNGAHGRFRRQVNDSSYLDRKELLKLLMPGLESRLDAIEQTTGDGNFNKRFNKQFNKQLEKEFHSEFVEMINEIIVANSSLVCAAIQKTCIKGVVISETISSTKKMPKDLTGVVLRGPPGPPGPAGKPGVQGPRGFGIYKTRMVSSSLSTSANQSSSVSLTCTAFGNPLPTFNWKTNAKNFTVSSTTNNETNEVTSTIRITDVGWNDRGRVQCRANNYFGEDTREGALAVFIAPIIHMSSAVASANIGSVGMLPPCNVTSEPKATITWRKGFGDLKSGSKVVNGSLIIPDIDWLDTGYYVCEAENFLGKTSGQVLLRTQKLHFRKTPSKDTCSAAGPAKYGSQMKATWRRKGGQPLQSPETVTIVRDLNFIQATLMGYLGSTKDTQYECKITDGELAIDYTFVPPLPDYAMKSSYVDTCGSGKHLTEGECKTKAVALAKFKKSNWYFTNNANIRYSGTFAWGAVHYGCQASTSGYMHFNTNPSGHKQKNYRSICKS